MTDTTARKALEQIVEAADNWVRRPEAAAPSPQRGLIAANAIVLKALDRLAELEETDKSNTELIGVFNVRELELEKDLQAEQQKSTRYKDTITQLGDELAVERGKVERAVIGMADHLWLNDSKERADG